MKKSSKKRLIFFIFCFIFVSQCKTYSIGIFGIGTISPALNSKKLTQNAGFGIGFVVDTNWIFALTTESTFANYLAADFVDKSSKLAPLLNQNAVKLQLARTFDISTVMNFMPAVFAGVHQINYRTIYPEIYSEELEIVYTDYGNAWFIIVSPSFNVNFELYEWMRLTVGIAYNIPLNLNYTVLNTAENRSLTNNDLKSLSLILSLQLGSFR